MDGWSISLSSLKYADLDSARSSLNSVLEAFLPVPVRPVTVVPEEFRFFLCNSCRVDDGRIFPRPNLVAEDVAVTPDPAWLLTTVEKELRTQRRNSAALGVVSKGAATPSPLKRFSVRPLFVMGRRFPSTLG